MTWRHGRDRSSWSGPSAVRFLRRRHLAPRIRCDDIPAPRVLWWETRLRMSTVVQVLCVPHDPTLPGVAARGAEAPEPLQRTVGHFAALRDRLAEVRPDVLAVVSGDHFNQWFYDNMPTFSIGKAVRASGPFPHEQELFGVGSYDTALEGDVARHLLRQGLQRGIDFSYSDDFILDHGFTVPLNFLRPEQDL